MTPKESQTYKYGKSWQFPSCPIEWNDENRACAWLGKGFHAWKNWYQKASPREKKRLDGVFGRLPKDDYNEF